MRGKDPAFLAHVFNNIDCSVVISDPLQDDNPLVYVNSHFVEMTGYTKEECFGHNCRFLQGPDTSPAAVDKIREAINTVSFLRIEILNYHKNGTPFWNELNLLPVKDSLGNALNFVGMQYPADDKRRYKKEILSEVMRIMDL